MFKKTMTVPERFRSHHPDAAAASSATSLRFGIGSRRLPAAIGIFAGIAAGILEKIVAALHATRMRQAAREINRFRDLIADEKTTASFATWCCDRAARRADQPPSQPRNVPVRLGGMTNEITERK